MNKFSWLTREILFADFAVNYVSPQYLPGGWGVFCLCEERSDEAIATSPFKLLIIILRP
jgi:hypothetical protein